MTGAQISKQIKKHSIFKKEKVSTEKAVQFENKQMCFIIAEFNKWILIMCVVFLKKFCLFIFFLLPHILDVQFGYQRRLHQLNQNSVNDMYV